MQPLRIDFETFLETFHRLARDERGASSIEYAMIAAGIGAVIVVTVNALGVSVKGMYDTVLSAFG